MTSSSSGPTTEKRAETAFRGAVVVVYECREPQLASREDQSLDQMDCEAVQASHSRYQDLQKPQDTREEEDSD